MENASKALIIAGAILISILLITIGIILINSGREVTTGGVTQMASQKIQTFNAQFTSYEGMHKGSALKGLKSLVTASNTTDESHQIAVTTDISGVTSLTDLSSSKNYKVTLKYCAAGSTFSGSTALVGSKESVTSENGYIYEILIQDANSNSNPNPNPTP